MSADEIAEIKYFTANVGARPSDPTQPLRQQVYFRALRTLAGVSIVLGQFRTRPTRLPLSVRPVAGAPSPVKPVTVWVDKTEEKGSDVNLASHLLVDGFEGKYELAAVISNDSDLRLPVQMVRDHLKRPIGILNPHQTNSHQLSSSATFVKRIRQGDLAACQFPDAFADGRGAITKPNAW